MISKARVYQAWLDIRLPKTAIGAPRRSRQPSAINRHVGAGHRGSSLSPEKPHHARRLGDDAGVVAEHVDRPASALARRSASFDAMLIADIGDIGTPTERRRNDLRFGDVAIDDNDYITARGEFAHASRANAAGAPGH